MDILTETQNLWQRFQRGGAFGIYLRDRTHLVVPVLVVFLAYSVATAAGTVITFGGTRSILVLVGLLGAPFVLIGSYYVQAIVFLFWLENRGQSSKLFRSASRSSAARCCSCRSPSCGRFPRAWRCSC